MKRQLKEIIDQALHDPGHDPGHYEVVFRDTNILKRVSLSDFLSTQTSWYGENNIPFHRISKIYENGHCIFERQVTGLKTSN